MNDLRSLCCGMCRPVFFFVASILPGFAYAQGDIWQQFKTRFPDEAAVFVERSETQTMLINGDSLQVYADVKEDILHLKEQTDYLSGKRVYGSHFSQVNNLKARTLVWDKNRYKEMDVTSFKKNSDRDRGIFFDDAYYYSFDFPAVASRNRTQLEYRESVKDPRFVSGYVFSSYLSQGKTTYTIKASRDVELVYKVMNDPGKQIQFRKTEKAGMISYEWFVENLPSLKNEDHSPSIRYYAPHVICYVKSYRTKKGTVNVISNLDDLYQWYYTFIDGLNKESSPELEAIVKKIKSVSSSEVDVVKNVFYWVQTNIQYIAFEQGMRGLIPHHGSYICEKRYGDCKDMANLIVNMLQLADIKAYHTWIGTRDLPYRYTEVPTPIVDNHMIATYISPEGKYYFLDATSDYTPFGFPSSMIQGKEALIGLDAKRYEVKEVPVLEKEKNQIFDSVAITMENNQLVGTGRSSLTGYAKVFGGYELDRAEQEDVKKSVTRLIGKGSNKFFLDNYKISNLDQRDIPTHVHYNFRIADYFQRAGDEIYVNLNLNKDFYNTYIDIASRKSPKENEYQYVEVDYVEMVIPEGYVVDYLPPDVRNDNPLLGYELSYASKDNKVMLSKKMHVNYLLMQPSAFPQWNESVKKVSEAYRESIILKKK